MIKTAVTFGLKGLRRGVLLLAWVPVALAGEAAQEQKIEPAVGPAPPARAQTPPLPADAGATDTSTGAPQDLQELLRRRGWTVERDAQGNTILRRADGAPAAPPAGEVAPPAAPVEPPGGGGAPPAAAVEPPAPPLTRLQKTLEARGWQVQRLPDGSLVARPGGQQARAAEAPPAPSPSEKGPPAQAPADTPAKEDAGTGVPPDLQVLLRRRGWVVEMDGQGNTILRRAEGLPGEPPRGEVVPPAAPVEPPVPSLTRLQQALKARGWRVQRLPDGSLVAGPGVPGGATPVPAPRAPSQPPAWQALYDTLRERGWHVEREPDGALRLEPSGQRPSPAPARPTSPASSPDAAEGCPGQELETVGSGEIDLPVDSWKEARALSAAWIASRPGERLAVGKVRKVHRVYLVSIVGAASPHRLRHQIAIRAETGRVVVLN